MGIFKRLSDVVLLPITPAALAELDRYKYSGAEFSLAAKYVLSYFWTFVARFVPKTISPNMVTLCGSIPVMLLYAIVLVRVEHWFPRGAPLDVDIFALFTYFWYQTADNVDGKHAKATNMGSPLGEMFDHGWDTICIGLLTCITAMTLALESNFTLLVLLSVAYFLMHIKGWEQHFTGIMILPAIGGPVDIQLASMSIHLMAILKGEAFWATPIGELADGVPIEFASYTAGWTALGVATVTSLFGVLPFSVYYGLASMKSSRERIVEFLSIPFFLVGSGLLVWWCWISELDPAVHHIKVVWSLCIAINVYVQIRMIAGRLLGMHVDYAPFLSWTPSVLVINAYARQAGMYYVSESSLLWSVFLFAVFANVALIRQVVCACCGHLGLPVLAPFTRPVKAAPKTE